MSFYGSIYYQAGEAITKIFIQNLGKSNKGFLQGALENEVEIKADGRQGSFFLNTGNRWLQFKGDAENNVCTVYHAKPDDKNLKNYLVPIVKTTAPPNGAQVVELPLSDDVYFSTPAIYYDEAGHVIPTGNLMYFKIPKITIQQGIDDLTDRVTSLEYTTFTDHEGRISTNEANIGSVQSSITNINSLLGYRSDLTKNSSLTLTKAIGNIDTMRESIGDNDATITDALADIYQSYAGMNDSYRNLDTDIRNIKARLDAAGL